ncbi:MAG: zf-HC2 domain-containing protein [Planctomycetes bacterium]|nr:zf-HC2 domain-containing protein [Planctomycetota bacterium]
MIACGGIPIEEFHDGELPAAAAEEVRRHLAACASCARSLDELRRLEGLLKAAPVHDPPRVDDYGARVRERLRASGSARWKALLPLAAAAALAAVLWCTLPVDVAALVLEYAASTSPETRRAIETRIHQGGAPAVAVLEQVMRDGAPQAQAAAGVILARHPDPAVRMRLIEQTRAESEAPEEWELTEIGTEPTDDELVGCAFELLKSPRTREDAVRILCKLYKGGANRAVREAIVDGAKELLTSAVPRDQELGLELVRAMELRFLLADLVDLLDAPALRNQAHRVLVEQEKRDYGRDKQAWRRYFAGKRT